MQIRKILLLIILCISLGYDILDIPFNSIALANSGGGRSIEIEGSYNTEPTSNININKRVFGCSYIRYPASINYMSIYTLGMKRSYNFSFLDFGRLVDGITEKSFSAYNLLIETSDNYKLFNKLGFGYRTGVVFAKIDNYYSGSVILSLSARTRLKSDVLGWSIAINNLSLLIYESEGYGTKTPIVVNASCYYRPKYIDGYISVDIRYEDQFKTMVGTLSAHVQLAEKIKILSSINSNKLDYHIGNIGNDFFSGMGLGIEYQFRKYCVSIGLHNLGALGLISGLSIRTLSK